MYALIVILVSSPTGSPTTTTIDHVEFTTLAACKSARATYTEYFTNQQAPGLPLHNVAFLIPPCRAR
jgi:hypothetical protein